MPSYFLVLSLAALGASATQLRYQQPGHQMVSNGAAAGANPEVDAWHDEAKAKIEAECDEMMKKLWAEKRQKLQDIVDALRKQVEDAKAAVKAAEGDVGDELGHLKTENDHLRDASKPVDLSGPRKDVQDAQDRIDALMKKIAELEACVEELKQAERDLEHA